MDERECGFRLAAVDTFVLKAPAQPPVQTSFGIMHHRPALLVRVRDEHGATGWGEVWCNFPSVGAEHRARLVQSYLRPMLMRATWRSPLHCFESLSAGLETLAIQSGEYGPLAQAVAGIDMAVWDLLARRAGQPLWRLLSRTQSDAPAPRVRVYASGLNPTQPETLAAGKQQEGFEAFKLKVGFGHQRDEANLAALRATLGAAAVLMVDANQAWTLEEAVRAAQTLAQYGVAWLEEPMRADTPHEQWEMLAQRQPIPLAAGENVNGLAAFQQIIEGRGVSIIQPDVGKWGGFSYCMKVAGAALAHGKWLCPHWLGSGLGLAAALHFKAAVGGEGYVEVDANPNPLRALLSPPGLVVSAGEVTLGETPGLGVEPDFDALEPYLHRLGPV